MENIDYTKIVNAIRAEVDPEKIILFGSRARGDHRSDSDLDLLIVENEPFSKTRSRLKEIAKIRRALQHTLISKDILLYSKEEIEYWKDSVNHVIAHSLKEGQVLYERH
jgi:uncharacterized protein